MLIYTENITPRLRYVLNFIFSNTPSQHFRITDKLEEFSADGGPGINYSDSRIEGKFNIPCSGFLSETGVRDLDPGFQKTAAFPVFFPGGEADIEFDLFSAVFYMLSRYEEYLPFNPDKYGRFEAGESLAGKNGFLELPVVDIWIKDLREKLVNFYGGLKFEPVKFRFLPTCDIDMPYAYLHRSKARTAGARIKAGLQGGEDRKLRQDVLSGKKRDPFDTYTTIEAIHSLHRMRPRIFFLTSRYGRHDKSISPTSKAFKNLVKQTMAYADIGIHPSFRASDNPAELKRELGLLSAVTEDSVIHSRQHFLKFRLPGSYREFLAAGIRNEYSMGFASAAGFRAGTSWPFYFYDVEKDEETSLCIFPFQVMDRTLKDYMQLSPEQALQKLLSIIKTIRSTGGVFCSIWHNDAFSDHGEWKGWKDVYLQMIDSLAG